ncbi:MFS transporter [Microbacterium sp. A94]|uniref:MFS transporter n=1 Tax=Microbacterium sp. A94 TaxID=3450717 RepID=UPI003F4435C5
MTVTAPVPIPAAERIRYGALIVVMLLSFLLVTAEFLPNGMLTEIADGLGITPGQAGQMVTITALVGLFVAPTVGMVFPRVDRRTLLVWMALAAAASNLIVAVSPNLLIILLARFLLGAALSTFWSMSITVAVRIAGPERLGRAVMFTSAGTSLATVAGVPVGVMLGEMMDWRAVFALTGIVTGLLAIALGTMLPPVPPAQVSSFGLLLDTIRRPGVALGLTGHIFVVLGHFLAYTYIRLALERVPEVDGGTIVMLLAVFGIGGLIGNVAIGVIIDRTFRTLAVVAPAVIAVAVGATIVLSDSVLGVGIAVFVWGFFLASWLLVVNTWVGHRMPDRLEAGGSLVVVGFQAAIMVAAGVGGILVDSVGVEPSYALGVIALVIGAVLFGLSNRARG